MTLMEGYYWGLISLKIREQKEKEREILNKKKMISTKYQETSF